jgi:Fe-S-cluster-containing dehydrogenase component
MEIYTDYEKYIINKYSKELIINEKKQQNKDKLTWKETERLFNIAIQKMEDDKLPKCSVCDNYLKVSQINFCSPICYDKNLIMLKEEEEEAQKYREFINNKTEKEIINTITKKQFKKWYNLIAFNFLIFETLKDKYNIK